MTDKRKLAMKVLRRAHSGRAGPKSLGILARAAWRYRDLLRNYYDSNQLMRVMTDIFEDFDRMFIGPHDHPSYLKQFKINQDG